MSETDGLLRTREAAQALGVSVSTLKRWVDAGELKASRTVGKHRLIAAAEALRFARERSLPTADLSILLGVKDARHAAKGEGPSALASALRRGRAGEARSLILSGYANGRDAAALADVLIGPAMAQIGHEWGAGALDVFQEHRASRIVEASLFELVQRAPAPSASSRTLLAIGASPAGDRYTLTGLLAELALRELGWEVINLGPNLPLASLARAIEAHRPDLIWLSVNHLDDPGAFLTAVAEVVRSAERVGALLVAGGQALSPELRSRMDGAHFGDSLSRLRELARGLQAAEREIRPGPPAPPASSHP